MSCLYLLFTHRLREQKKKNNKKKWKLCCEAWNPKSKLIDTNKGQMDIGCHITSHFIFKICYDVSEDKSSPEFRSFRDNIYCLLSKRYNHTLKYDVVMKHRRIIVHWKPNRLIVVRFKQKKKKNNLAFICLHCHFEPPRIYEPHDTFMELFYFDVNDSYVTWLVRVQQLTSTKQLLTTFLVFSLTSRRKKKLGVR